MNGLSLYVCFFLKKSKDCVRNAMRALLISKAADDNGKFLATDARDNVDLSHNSAKAIGYHFQAFVPELMSIGVVDSLESVYVDGKENSA